MRSASQCLCSLLTTAPHSACLPESPTECISRTLLSFSLREAAQPSSFLTANSCQNTASLPRHLSWCGSPRVSSHLTVPCLEDSRRFSPNIQMHPQDVVNLVKCLPYKHMDLSSVFQSPHRKAMEFFLSGYCYLNTQPHSDATMKESPCRTLMQKLDKILAN